MSVTPRRLIGNALQPDAFERACRAAHPITFKEIPMSSIPAEIPQHSRPTPDGPASCEGSGTMHRERCPVCSKRVASK